MAVPINEGARNDIIQFTPGPTSTAITRLVQESQLKPGFTTVAADLRTAMQQQRKAKETLDNIRQELHLHRPTIRIAFAKDQTGSFDEADQTAAETNIPTFLSGIFQGLMEGADPNMKRILDGIDLEMTRVNFGDGNIDDDYGDGRRIDEPHMFVRTSKTTLHFEPTQLRTDLRVFFGSMFSDSDPMNGGGNGGESSLDALALALPPAKDRIAQTRQLELIKAIAGDLMPQIQKHLVDKPQSISTKQYLDELIARLQTSGMAQAAMQMQSIEGQKEANDLDIFFLITDEPNAGPIIVAGNTKYDLLKSTLKGMKVGYAATITPKQLARGENGIEYWDRVWKDLFGVGQADGETRQTIDLYAADNFKPAAALGGRNANLLRAISSAIGTSVAHGVTAKVNNVVYQQLQLTDGGPRT